MKSTEIRGSVEDPIAIEANVMATKAEARARKNAAALRKVNGKRRDAESAPSWQAGSAGQATFKPVFSKAFFDFMDEMEAQTRQRREAALRIIRAHKKRGGGR
ncbi:hypothetical protein [Rugamonas sp. DEMB1]|uniref:hypothetical protein n=1 Tax=Rugamonas sp. DEMB1 TaxID=3039386 RepID=UPI002448CC6C|nr:hypothetical protein [Rugamonas sp. DEMB1]WGG52276.1 hypothetical protein QC826_09000 [Rugamonas sp. DEMB1]